MAIVEETKNKEWKNKAKYNTMSRYYREFELKYTVYICWF